MQSYSQRTLLAYIGLEIFLDHPLLGVGWQGSLDEAGYGPQLAAAHAPLPRRAAARLPVTASTRGASTTPICRLCPTWASAGSSS